MTLEQYRIEMGLGPVPVATGTKKARTDDNGFIRKDEIAPEGKQKAPKYNAQKTKAYGITFDSKREAEYYGTLMMELRSGSIAGIARQCEFVLQDGDGTLIRYKADFIVWNYDGTAEVHEVKGMELPSWKIKEKLFRAKYPHVPLIIIK
jgi:hypothetical protein